MAWVELTLSLVEEEMAFECSFRLETQNVNRGEVSLISNTFLLDRMCAVERTVTTRITKLKLKELDIQIIKFAVRSSCGGALGNAQDTGVYVHWISITPYKESINHFINVLRRSTWLTLRQFTIEVTSSYD